MQSKGLLVGIAAVVLVGLLIAFRGIGDKSSRGNRDSSKSRVEEKETGSSGSSSSKSGSITEVAGSSGSSRSGSNSRITRSSDGAASIEVTPATKSVEAPTVTDEHVTSAMAELTSDSLELTPEQAQAMVVDLATKFLNEKDPDARIDIADELGTIDNEAAMKKVLELLGSETNPEVMTSLLEALQGMEAAEGIKDDITNRIADMYGKVTDPDTREAAQDVLGDYPTQKGMETLRSQFADNGASFEDRLNAAENILRVHASEDNFVSDQEAADINNRLKENYAGLEDPAQRMRTAMALATAGKDNLSFFQDSLKTEQDPQVRNMLERLIRMFTNQQ